MRKIIILGCRSGTSLMAAILREGFGLKEWWDGNSLPKHEASIGWNGKNFLKPEYEWDFGKNPSFVAVLKELEELYHPIYIWMDRDIEERIDSHRKLGVDVRKVYLPNRYVLDKMRFDLPENLPEISNAHASRLWFEFVDREIKNHLETYNPTCLIINFKKFMINPLKRANNIGRFIGIDHDFIVKQQKKIFGLIDIKHREMAHSLEYWRNYR